MVDQAVLSGQVVVVAHEDDFIARYIGRVLQRSGSEVLDLASFDGRPAGLPQVCGIAAYVVSQRHKTAICDHIACQKEQPPALLLIGVESSSTVPPRSATMDPPFAAYQVVEVVAGLPGRSDAVTVAEAARNT